MPRRENTPDNLVPPLFADTAVDLPVPVSELIDVTDGIERVMGNRELYARMLTRFRNDYRRGVLPIQEALASDRTLAHRLTHTLKGSTGMIGAHRLHQCASMLELAIRTGAAREQACLAALATAFHQVLLEIDRLLASALEDIACPAVAPRILLQDAALLSRLRELLRAGDGAAVDMMAESGASLRAILGEATLAQLTAAVNAFDYDAALRALAPGGE